MSTNSKAQNTTPQTQRFDLALFTGLALL